MAPAPEEGPLPPSLRFLKALVIILMLTMIGGLLAVVWVFVTRLPAAMGNGPDLPATLALPAGEVASAVTFGKGWTAVVTESGRMLIYGTDGALRQEVVITP